MDRHSKLWLSKMRKITLIVSIYHHCLQFAHQLYKIQSSCIIKSSTSFILCDTAETFRCFLPQVSQLVGFIFKLSRESKILVRSVAKTDKVVKVISVKRDQGLIGHIAKIEHHVILFSWFSPVMVFVSRIVKQGSNKVKLVLRGLTSSKLIKF